ncbi:hypothetical protein OEA41_007029 [Lepraria neglecta]|uniref:Uncharacterized protein n=1 Tax=Lepraria neglecta TaxID=209136 RepID=A0AAE0DKT2_9LECA|nr:hypothetical protein OEA41_007029 [Lepraria neglecta]
MTLILHTDLSCQNSPAVGLAHAEVTADEWATVAHALEPRRDYLVKPFELHPGWKQPGNFTPMDHGRSSAQDRTDGIITIKISIAQDVRLHLVREEYTDDQVYADDELNNVGFYLHVQKMGSVVLQEKS